ncbi:MAG: SGNH/GDSL hydrolase family protein [Planctomycetes bacterium]|nr:SGNH/GDSL hydrolase family protein [Planctomycetota bacterium]
MFEHFPRLLPLALLTVASRAQDDRHWIDARTLTIEGQGWTDTEAPWDRLPARAKALVREQVWNLSRHSAGIAVRFVSDTPRLDARWTVTSKSLAMPHMPASGVSGLDLYARDANSHWRWVSATRPSAQTNTVTFFQGVPAQEREYLLYLPLYIGTQQLELAVPDGARLVKAPERPKTHTKPIVFYGTSITHGASASRPGMTHPAILGRRFDRPVINLGFSGNGRLEPEVAQLLTELDAAVYVIDCLPNVNAKQVAERARPLVDILRKTRPDTPILLVEDRDYQNGWFVDSRRAHNRANQHALRTAYEAMEKDGLERVFYLEGPALLGEDGEATVDSSHPNDLGFVRQADAFERVLRGILPR